jgi:hypothetical protein
MQNTEQHNFAVSAETAPAFATQAEIEMADRLRRQLRERYFWSLAHVAASTDTSRPAD